MEEPTDFFFLRETMSKLLFNNIAFSPPLSTRRRQHKTKLFFHRFETTSSSLSSSLFLLAVSAKEMVFPDSKVNDPKPVNINGTQTFSFFFYFQKVIIFGRLSIFAK